MSISIWKIHQRPENIAFFRKRKSAEKRTRTATDAYTADVCAGHIHIYRIKSRFPPFPHRVEIGVFARPSKDSHSFHRVFHTSCESSAVHCGLHIHCRPKGIHAFFPNPRIFIRADGKEPTAPRHNPQSKCSNQPRKRGIKVEKDQNEPKNGQIAATFAELSTVKNLPEPVVFCGSFAPTGRTGFDEICMNRNGKVGKK